MSNHNVHNKDHTRNHGEHSPKVSDNGQPPNGKGKTAAAPDPFDPERLRLSQDFAQDAAVKKILTRVPVRKPHDQEFVRVRAGDEWQLPTWIFEDKTSRGDTYLVAPEMLPELGTHARPALVVVAVTRQANLFLWPLKLPRSDGRDNLWNESARDCAKLAEKNWICVRSEQQYQPYEPSVELPEPAWPADCTMGDLLRLGFGDRDIDSPDHPVVKRLRGEV